MSEQELSATTEESELDYLERDATSFDFGLFGGDQESGFHLKNDPEAPFQRTNVVQRKGALNIKCTCVDIVHGQWGPDEPDARATVIVLLFRFDSLRRARRIISANIELKFFDSEGRHRKNPEVVDISLNNNFSIAPTKRSESLTRAAESGVDSGILGLNLSGSLRWEKKIDQETTDATRIIGSIDRLDAPFGPCNSASWTLTENATTKTGVPVALRVGILLKRTTDDDFNCTVNLVTKADLKTRMAELFGGRERDDPILFRTTLPPTNKLREYDVANLGNFNVAEVEDITFMTIRKDAIKD